MSGVAASTAGSNSNRTKDNDGADCFLTLPGDVWTRGVLRFLSLSDLLVSVRPLCCSLKDLADKDPRWIPIIAPPDLCDEVLSIEKHGKQMQQLFIMSLKSRQRRRGKPSTLDEFFNLIPWRSSGESYPTPWLHRMVYHKPCPTTSTTAITATATTENTSPVRKRMRIGGSNKAKRVESAAFRVKIATPLEPDELVCQKNKSMKIILQGINLRNGRGEQAAELPDHDIARFKGWNRECLKLMGCFFEGDCIIVPELLECSVGLARGGNCRRSRSGIRQVNVGCLSTNFCDHVVRNYCPEMALSGNTGEMDVQLVCLLATHMFPRFQNCDWCYSFFFDPQEKGYELSVVSSYAFSEWINCPDEQVVLYTTMMVQTVLKNLCLDFCENSPCIMNNFDCIFDMEQDSSLIPCPTCLCKLRMKGLIPDVKSFWKQLYQVLSKKPYKHVCQKDLELLQIFGAAS